MVCTYVCITTPTLRTVTPCSSGRACSRDEPDDDAIPSYTSHLLTYWYVDYVIQLLHVQCSIPWYYMVLPIVPTYLSTTYYYYILLHHVVEQEHKQMLFWMYSPTRCSKEVIIRMKA